MTQLTHEEFKERERSAIDDLNKVIAFLNYEFTQRLSQRSYGELTVVFYWEDGHCRNVRVVSGHMLKAGSSSGLPNGHDHPPNSPPQARGPKKDY